MKKSPVYPNYETGDYGGYEFDPQVDFTQFLEEARQHAREMNLQNPEENAKSKEKEEKKSKKSWKTSIFKWWKSSNKKSEATTSKEPANSSYISNPRKGHTSGPIYGCGGGGAGDTKHHRRQTSGPLINLFNPTKRTENKTPYMSLDQINNNPQGVKAYGPVYLVT